jgi:transportin-3
LSVDFLTQLPLKQLLSHTPMVLEFLLEQSQKISDGGVQLHERNRKVLRCLLSWVSSDFLHVLILYLSSSIIALIFAFCTQVRAGCFSEIPRDSLPTHPLLNFVFNSLQVKIIVLLVNFVFEINDILLFWWM